MGEGDSERAKEGERVKGEGTVRHGDTETGWEGGRKGGMKI